MLTSSEPSGHEPRLDLRLIAIVNNLISLTPAMVILQRDRYPRPWAEDLRALLQHPETEPLRAGIEAVTREKLRDSAAMGEFFERYHRTPTQVLVSVSRLAASNAASTPAASFILAVLCLYLLAGQLPSLLRSPRPHWTPWFEVPYACITAALQLDGLWPARQLVQFTYEMIDVTRMILHAEIERELERCRGFARIIEQRIEFAISNLADDLRESCRPAPENFRAEVGAIAWTLGFVPESAMFRAGSAAGAALPSRRFFRQLVRHSLVCIPTDALVQYLWLELRDRGPFDVRSHPALYAVISRVYDQSPLESLMFRMLTFSSDAPGKLYARGLTAWFRGDGGGSDARRCFSFWLEMVKLVPPLEAGRIYLLLDLLAGAPTVTPDTRHDWDVLLRELRELRRQKMTAQARGEPLLARPSVPRFFLADELQRQGNAAALIDAEEEWRSAALSYWLATSRPRLPEPTRARLGEELAEEDDDIETLRGAYFEMLFRTLPEHYHRFAFEMNTAVWDPPKPNFERGQRKSVEMLARLHALRERMAAREQWYAAVRPDGPSGFTVLQDLLGRHRRGTAPIV